MSEPFAAEDGSHLPADRVFPVEGATGYAVTDKKNRFVIVARVGEYWLCSEHGVGECEHTRIVTGQMRV